MKRIKPPAVGNRHEHLPNSMPCERASKRRFRKRVRAFGMRRSRYIGLAITHVQHLGIAAAINVVRAVAWLDGDELAPTRVSALPGSLKEFPNSVKRVREPTYESNNTFVLLSMAISSNLHV
jgi:hypothetical protein